MRTAQDFNPLDRIDRRRWSIVLGAILCGAPLPAVQEMVACGYTHFLAAAKPITSGHLFKSEDFRRMFLMLQMTVDRGRSVGPQALSGALDGIL
jgi:hypothetical protein